MVARILLKHSAEKICWLVRGVCDLIFEVSKLMATALIQYLVSLHSLWRNIRSWFMRCGQSVLKSSSRTCNGASLLKSARTMVTACYMGPLAFWCLNLLGLV